MVTVICGNLIKTIAFLELFQTFNDKCRRIFLKIYHLQMTYLRLFFFTNPSLDPCSEINSISYALATKKYVSLRNVKICLM